MRKYTTPSMDIKIFSNVTETAEDITSAAYVQGLESIDKANKAQVNMDSMHKITKFTF